MRAYALTEKKYESRKRKARLQKLARYYCAFLVAFFVTVFWSGTSSVGIKQQFLRTNFQIRGIENPSDKILLLAFDNAVFEKYGKPLPRKVPAEVFENLVNLNAQGLFLDFFFSQDLREIEANKRIAKALSKVPSIVGSGKIKTVKNQESTDFEITPEIAAAVKSMMDMRIHLLGRTAQYFDHRFFKGESTETRIPITKALRELSGATFNFQPSAKIINYYGPPGAIPRITVQELLEWPTEKLKPLIENKLIFIGIQNIGTNKPDEEQFSTVYSGDLMYGVEIHATIASNLLNGDWITAVSDETELVILIVMIFLIAVLQIISSKMFFSESSRNPIVRALSSQRVSYLIIAAILCSAVVLTYYLFAYKRIWISIAPALFLYTILSVFITAVAAFVLNSRFGKLLGKRLGFDG